ncbi:MAG: hypothetical protein BGO55_06840 [Sphingobacteriales bacterium 50-39]|nr:hypothetical protein [Sphingobacteriales bacterium]OJW52969.1 MAG: hypothetical protein BGO55_06840 [Sphingobacteriales bacterium 50-39]
MVSRILDVLVGIRPKDRSWEDLLHADATIRIKCTSGSGFTHGSGPIGNWLLMAEHPDIGPNPKDIRPARDSSVLLTLNDDRTFISRLDNKIVSQGSYTLVRNSASDYYPTLQLDGFKTTGIFSQFTLYQLGTNGQVLSVYDGMSMKVAGDTMTLYGLPTPAGMLSYTFLRD